MEYEKEEKVKKIQNAIMNSLANIYQKAEKIDKVDKQRADWILKKIEEIRKEIENNQTQPIEFLSEIMLLQTEIMNFLDTDVYKQKTIEAPKSTIEKELASMREQTISEEDKAALLQNQSTEIEKKEPSGEQNTSKELQVYMPEKRHFWQTILEKILNLFGRKQEAC